MLSLFSSVLSLQTILTDSTGDAVSRLFKNVTFNIADQYIEEKEGIITIKGTMRNITCGSISMVDFDITSGYSDTTEVGYIDIMADGLTLDCNLIMDLESPSTITGNLEVNVNYSDIKDSTLDFHTEIRFDTLGVPNIAEMPADDCTVALDFAIDLSDSNWPKFLVPVLEAVMKRVLKSMTPTLLCGQLGELIGTNLTQLLNSVAGKLDPLLNGTEGPFEPENPPTLPTEVEYINFEEDMALKVLDWFINKNVNGKPMVDRLIDLVIPNGVISKRFHLTPRANISADFDLDLFTLDSFSIFDILTPVSKTEFPNYHPSNQSLYFHMKLDTLGFNISGTLTNTTTNATEPFTVSSTMSGLETKLIVQIALEPLKAIAKLPVLSIDCLMTLVNDTSVQLLDFTIASLNPIEIWSPNGLIILADELIQAVEMLYGGVILDFVHGAVGTTVRSFMNKVIKIIQQLKPGCESPPTPSPKHQLSKAYWAETISASCVVAFIVFVGVVYLIKNKRRRSESQYANGLLEDKTVNH